MDADNEEGFADYSALKQKIRKGKDVSWQGQKDFEPDESTSQCEKLQASRNAMFEVLAEKRPISGKSMSRGVLDDKLQVVTIHVPRGNHLQSIGRSVKGLLTLYLEEACFLVNIGVLELEGPSGRPLSFRNIYTAILNSADGWCSFERYQTYAYLKRLGYNVTRSATIHPSTPVTPPSMWVFPITTQIIRSCISTFISAYTFIQSVWSKRYSYSWRLQNTQIKPLLPRHHPHISYASIFSALRIVPSAPPNFVHGPKQSTIDFDVYKPLPGWKKTNPGMPAFRVSVRKASEPFPSPQGLQQLLNDNRTLCKSQSQRSPSMTNQTDSALVISVVDGSEGICSFVRFQDDHIPRLI